jgi:hypothetical protein
MSEDEPTEMQHRDRAVLGGLHPGIFGAEEPSSGSWTSAFDGGAWESALPIPHYDPRPPTPTYREGA